jgi:hypothetical protein
MVGFVDFVFGPVRNKDACYIFLGISIIYLIGILIYAFQITRMFYKKKQSFDKAGGLIMFFVTSVLLWYMYKLMYGMCLNSL